ncbi:hypothetical protein U1Q18_021961 [Sarracenia purpurea var. burkii]
MPPTISLRNQGWLDVILSRWSTATHAFVIGFGNIAFTLEDVCPLMHLPIFGAISYSPETELFADAVMIYTVLRM